MCSKLAFFLCRDRVTPIDECPITPRQVRTVDATQRLQSTPIARPRITNTAVAIISGPSVSCPYCKQKISANNKRHELFECPAANKIFDPGPDESFSRASPLARRAVSLAKVNPPAEDNLQW